MADSHQAFRFLQQSKKENPHLILQNNHLQLSSTLQQTPALHCPDQNPNTTPFEGAHVVGPSSFSFAFPSSSGDDSLYSIQNVRFLDHRFSYGADAVSLSLAPHRRDQRPAPSELNPKRYDVVSVRGATTPKANNELRSSVPLGPFTGYASILKRSSFLSPAQQLLDDFCGVGRGVLDSASFDSPSEGSGTAEDPIGCSHGNEHCWKSSRLAPMLDEVYRRYKLYCQQMHSVVASFETVAGLQNAAPYISFAFKAMSKHFRYLKNAILDHIQYTGKALIGHNGKDETPRVWTADQGFHSQKAVQSSIFLQHPVWRSQRGLPDHAVAVLRAWLFEHFLHPYPTDLEKQLLAQRTSLSRNQVSNWFINARVRLWKPMVEEILMLETKQAQMAAEGEANRPTDHLPSANPLPLGKSFHKMEDTQSKPSRDKLFHLFEQRAKETNLPYNNFSTNYQMDGCGIEKTASKGISLALGLHQNNRFESSRSFPVNISHHFGLDKNSEQFLRNGSEAQNQNSGKDLRVHLFHEFTS